MNPRRSVLISKINTYLGALLIFSFGLFVLILGFGLQHMVNPIAEAFAAQHEDIQKELQKY